MYPKVSQFLYLHVESMDEEESKREYKSRIADIGEETITMEVPIDEQTGRYKRLVQGDRISAFFVGEGGVKNYFDSRVVGLKEEAIRLVLIEKPQLESIVKVQRRNFFRVPARLEVAVKLSDQVRFLAATSDVSGGGVSFITDDQYPVEQGMQIFCWMVVPFKNESIEHVSFQGELVRVKQLENGKCLCMLQFAKMENRDREKVMRYCFERQLDFRKK